MHLLNYYTILYDTIRYYTIRYDIKYEFEVTYCYYFTPPVITLSTKSRFSSLIVGTHYELGFVENRVGTHASDQIFVREYVFRQNVFFVRGNQTCVRTKVSFETKTKRAWERKFRSKNSAANSLSFPLSLL